MKPLTINGYGCDACGQKFDDLEELRDHTNDKGEPCEGGVPV